MYVNECCIIFVYTVTTIIFVIFATHYFMYYCKINVLYCIWKCNPISGLTSILWVKQSFDLAWNVLVSFVVCNGTGCTLYRMRQEQLPFCQWIWTMAWAGHPCSTEKHRSMSHSSFLATSSQVNYQLLSFTTSSRGALYTVHHTIKNTFFWKGNVAFTEQYLVILKILLCLKIWAQGCRTLMGISCCK